ncbi:hypothetical protein ACCO45_007032 [Purpureocillium lilacinum]|uniref:Uncharacterized protein n=1 Tax=Purpureocillium lilacinum TaxID=33203 RepID=A0ACC4DR83_PURLI
MAEQSSLRTYDPLYPEPVENKYLLRKMFEFRDAFEPVFARQTKKVKHQAAVALIELSRMSYTGVNAGTFLVLGNWLGKSKVDDKRLHYTPSDELLKDIPANPSSPTSPTTASRNAS